MVCKNHSVVLDADGLATITVDDVDGGSTDKCELASRTLSQTNLTCADLGTKTYTLTGVDGEGNMASCNANVTVTDNILPQAKCKSHNVQLNVGGTAGNGKMCGSFGNDGRQLPRIEGPSAIYRSLFEGLGADEQGTNLDPTLHVLNYVTQRAAALRRELATIGALINEREGELAEVIQQANSHINLKIDKP